MPLATKNSYGTRERSQHQGNDTCPREASQHGRTHTVKVVARLGGQKLVNLFSFSFSFLTCTVGKPKDLDFSYQVHMMCAAYYVNR